MEYLSNPENSHKAPKILDYNFYNPTLKSLKYGGKPEKTDIVTRDLEVLTIENLCKYLSSEEIELVNLALSEYLDYLRSVKIRYISWEEENIEKILILMIIRDGISNWLMCIRESNKIFTPMY